MMSTARYLLGIALVTAGLVAACGDAPSDSLGQGGLDRGNGSSRLPDDGNGNGGGDGTGTGGGTGAGNGTGGGAGPTPSDPTKAPDTEAKQYFAANVHPSLAQSCGSCHESGPGPAWIKKTDVEVSYKMMFQLGYVSLQSRIILKGPHQGTNGTTTEQTQKFTTWVNMELKAGGTKAPPNILEKIGGCFDRAKFDAIGLGNMRTVQRTNNNNTNNVTPWNENANNCTGCNNAPCRTCHSGDDATLFVNSIGNPNLPQNFTFEQSKLTNPAYVTKYIGVSPTGEPIASNAIKIKAEATQKDKAYTHPMYRVDANLDTRINDFVNDAIAKYKATNGACQ
jgi:hypothetical protein